MTSADTLTSTAGRRPDSRASDASFNEVLRRGGAAFGCAAVRAGEVCAQLRAGACGCDAAAGPVARIEGRIGSDTGSLSRTRRLTPWALGWRSAREPAAHVVRAKRRVRAAWLGDRVAADLLHRLGRAARDLEAGALFESRRLDDLNRYQPVGDVDHPVHGFAPEGTMLEKALG